MLPILPPAIKNTLSSIGASLKFWSNKGSTNSIYSTTNKVSDISERDFAHIFKLMDQVHKGRTFEEVISKLPNDLDPNELTHILKHIISQGDYGCAISFQGRFGLDISHLEEKLFMQGFKTNCAYIGKGINPNTVCDFLFLWKSPHNFFIEIALMGYIEIAGEILKRSQINIQKLDDDQMRIAIKNHIERKEEGAIFFGFSTNYESLLNDIAINPEEYLKLLKKGLALTENEKAIGRETFSKVGMFDGKTVQDLTYKKIKDFFKETAMDLELEIQKETIGDAETLKDSNYDVYLANLNKSTPVWFMHKNNWGKTQIFIYQSQEIWKLKQPSDNIIIYSDYDMFLKEIKEFIINDTSPICGYCILKSPGDKITSSPGIKFIDGDTWAANDERYALAA